MPRKPINYNNACIYKIVCNDVNITECYVGSTTNFTKRKTNHKSHCNNENDNSYNYYVYRFIRDHGGWDNWSMVEIEKYECKDGRELETRERHYIEHLKAELNKYIPTRTDDEWRQDYNKQYYQDNVEKIKEIRKQYRHVNKEKIKEKLKQKYTCQCGSTLRINEKARHQRSIKHQTYINSLIS